MRIPGRLLFLLLGPGLGLGLGGCGDGVAPLTIEPASHDFGAVLQGETREKVFRLTNRGDRTMAFRAQPNCACFAVAQDLRPLDPGASLQFRVLFDTNRAAPGPVEGKYITVYTDRQDLEPVVVPLEGEVIRAYDVTPKEFRWGRIDGRPANYEPRTIRVRPEPGYELTLRKAVSNPPVVDFRVEEAAHGGLDVHVTLKKDMQRRFGPLRAQVRLDLTLQPPEGEPLRQSAKVAFAGFWAIRP